MIAELYLIAPADADAGALVDMLKPILATAEIAALLLPRGERSAEAYATLVRSVAPLAQAAGCARCCSKASRGSSGRWAPTVSMSGVPSPRCGQRWPRSSRISSWAPDPSPAVTKR